MDAVFPSDSEDSETTSSRDAPQPNGSAIASKHSRPSPTSKVDSVTTDAGVDYIQAALCQAQLAASDAHVQAQKDARSGGSSVSRKSHTAVEKPAKDTKDALREVAKRIFILYSPWKSWSVSGCYIVGSLGALATEGITANDSPGNEILSYVPASLAADFMSNSGQALVASAMSSIRSSHINRLRTHGPTIFGPGFEQQWFPSKFERGSVEKLQELLGAYMTPKGKRYSLFPPILFPDGSTNKSDIFLNPALTNVLKVMLFGPSSLTNGGKPSGRQPTGAKWALSAVTPGAIALAAILVRFLLSPDDEFSQAGSNSGINYAESHKKYKEMLIKKSSSSVSERIFSKFNASLFGTVPILCNDLIVDNGDYDSELEQFENELLAESLTDTASSAKADKTTLPSPLPAPPLQVHSDHCVSLSVTSRVSHTVTASSQVLNVINSSLALPPEPAVREPSPSAEIVQPPARPTAKKKGTKSSKLATTASTSDADANTAPALKERTTRRSKAVTAPEEQPTRALRKRH